MKVLLSGLAVLVLCTAAEARPVRRAPQGFHQPVKAAPESVHPVMAPLEEAATQCFADTVMANAKATGLAKSGRWYEAAGVIGFLCRPEVGRMVAAHDRMFGPGSGDRYFKGAYAHHLDKQLAIRLQPLLEPKAVASAEPPTEKAVLKGDVPDAIADTAAH